MKFSLIIPIYNGENYVSQCIDSLICQTYENWEAICINDGSNDQSLNILQKYACKDNRIQVYSQLNTGVAVAREMGMKYVTGDYFLFLDVDDTLEINGLQLFYNKIISVDTPDIVVGGISVICKNRVLKYLRPGFVRMNRIDYLKHIMTGKAGWELCGKVYRQALANSELLHPQGIRIGEDASVFVQLVSKADTIVGCDAPIYNYIQLKNSASHKKGLVLAEETLLAALFIKSFFEKKEFYKEIQINIDAMCLLFYSNSTRRAFLVRSHPLMQGLRRNHFSFSALCLLPWYKAIYILISYYLISKK